MRVYYNRKGGRFIIKGIEILKVWSREKKRKDVLGR